MALSDSVSTNGYEGRYYTVSWSASQSVANNTSTISWTLSCAGGSSSWYAERTLVVTVAGKTVVNKADRVTRYAGNIALPFHMLLMEPEAFLSAFRRPYIHHR